MKRPATAPTGRPGFRALPDGGLAVAGLTQSKGAGSWDAWVLRLDANGQLLWDKTFGGAEEDKANANAIALLPDGGLALAGLTNSKGAGGKDAWVFTIPPEAMAPTAAARQ